MKALLFSLALVAGTAHAEFWSGNDLYNRINGSDTDKLLALGYVAGAADAGQTANHCIPQTVQLGQVFEIVTDALRDASSVRHQYSADSIVYVALKRVWPCRNRNSSTL